MISRACTGNPPYMSSLAAKELLGLWQTYRPYHHVSPEATRAGKLPKGKTGGLSIGRCMGPLPICATSASHRPWPQGKAANEAYALAGYRANDGNASRLKGNERISARVQEIVGRAAERAEVSLERVLRELKAIAFSNISKAVTWGPSVQVREEEEDGHRVKVIVNAVLLVPMSQSSTGAL